MVNQDNELNDNELDDLLTKARLITEKHTEAVIQKAKEIEVKITQTGPLAGLWDDIKLCQNLLADFISGQYKDIPLWTIAVLTFALLYLINPIELIPDVIPVVGYFNDALLIVVAIKIAKDELMKYKAWKEREHCMANGRTNLKHD